MRRTRAPIDRFTAKYRVDPESGCWIWTAYLSPNGYGKFYDGERVGLAHRFAYTHFVGPIPDGMELDHLCRTPACVNPAHLEAVTHKVNTLRGNTVATINKAKTHCPSDHEYTPDNTLIVRRTDGRVERVCRTCNRERSARRYWARKAAAA